LARDYIEIWNSCQRRLEIPGEFTAPRRHPDIGRNALSNTAPSGQPPFVSKKSSGASLHPRLRVICGESIALGPGKVDLLELVFKTGSIREAADRMGMSYMRAWTLIKTMNACFREPLVEAVRGGSKHGGAKLTATGRESAQALSRDGGRLPARDKDTMEAAQGAVAELLTSGLGLHSDIFLEI
jgi:molybdate transport system regulatory protein